MGIIKRLTELSFTTYDTVLSENLFTINIVRFRIALSAGTGEERTGERQEEKRDNLSFVTARLQLCTFPLFVTQLLCESIRAS